MFLRVIKNPHNGARAASKALEIGQSPKGTVYGMLVSAPLFLGVSMATLTGCTSIKQLFNSLIYPTNISILSPTCRMLRPAMFPRISRLPDNIQALPGESHSLLPRLPARGTAGTSSLWVLMLGNSGTVRS